MTTIGGGGSSSSSVIFKPGRRPSDASGMDHTALTLNVSDLDSDMDDASNCHVRATSCIRPDTMITTTCSRNSTTSQNDNVNKVHVDVNVNVDSSNDISSNDNNDENGTDDKSDDTKRLADLLAALAFVTPATVALNKPVPKTPIQQQQPQQSLDTSKASSTTSTCSSCQERLVLEKKLMRLQEELQLAMAQNQSLQQQCSLQQHQVERLVQASQAQRLRDLQSIKVIAFLERQITSLRQHQQQQQQVSLGAAAASASTTSTTSSTCSTSYDSDDDEEEEDGQVSDRIAAVKASLEWGSHQAKANQVSLDQDLETFDRLRQKLAMRRGVHAATTMSTPTAAATVSATISTTTTTAGRPPIHNNGSSHKRTKRQSRKMSASMIQEAKVNQELIVQELATCRRLLQDLAAAKSAQAVVTSSTPFTTTTTAPLATATTTSASLGEQVSWLVASVQESNEAIYQAEIEQWKQALLDLSHYEGS